MTRCPRVSSSEGLTVMSMRIQSEICAFLGYFAVYSGNSLPTFRDNLTVPSSRVKQFKNAGKQIELVWSVIGSRVDEGANQAAGA